MHSPACVFYVEKILDSKKRLWYYSDTSAGVISADNHVPLASGPGYMAQPQRKGVRF